MDSDSRAAHWDQVYRSKSIGSVSWFRPHLDRSLALLDSLALPPESRIIDVGAGASSFVADLLQRGFRDLTALDISEEALSVARAAMGSAASAVRWVVADITRIEWPASTVDFWHDRAAFHFLTDAADRLRYAANARRAVAPGGHLLISGFAADGPLRCSNLDVLRATPDDIHAQLGDDFRIVARDSEIHRTPWGAEQAFSYCLCQRA